MTSAWSALQAGKPPRMVADRLNEDLAVLTDAVRARNSGRVTQEAVDVAQSALDLELRYRPPAEIDAERFHLWTQQLRVHAAARDAGGVAGAVAVLEWIRDRIARKFDPGPARGAGPISKHRQSIALQTAAAKVSKSSGL